MTPRTAGRYEIVRLLGRGGMASVHLARQPALDREVALKELHPAHAGDAAFAQRFLHESRVGGALNHASVVSVIEYFEHDGVPFIAMEYLERGSLRPFVGRMTLAQVAGLLESVLGGLAEAAEQGIVHRDLKPENLLVTADGHVKIADFGIAKAIGQVCMTEFRTATGQVVGTPAYMAPEQVTGGDITPQADLYATGLIAYELLAGRHPFEGIDAPMALLLRQVNDEPPPLAELRPDLPPGVVAWVHAMLAKEPAARPAGAAHAWDRLEGAVSDELGPLWRRGAALVEPGAERVTGVHPSVLAELPSAAAPSELSGIYSVLLPPVPAPAPPTAAAAPPAAPRRRGRALLGSLAAALLAAVAAFMFTSSSGDAPRAAAPAGPSLEERVRQVVAPALRTNARLSRELEALVPGSDPEDALERADAALAATTAAREQRVAPARPALRAQAAYLRVVRSALKLRASEAQLAGLGAVSARLVSRLERLEATVPRASASVGGARKLKRWVLAELAPAPVLPPVAAPLEAPAAVPTPAPATTSPAPTATPTPTVTPPVAHPQLAPRRGALRERLQTRRSRRMALRPPGA